jgi:23S rRNA-/tRNA-specific pseudouridylate synthase
VYTSARPRNRMLDILYEDSALLFVNKPAGIVVQRGYDADEPVLFEIAAAYAKNLFLIQRLDRGTRPAESRASRSFIKCRRARMHASE